MANNTAPTKAELEARLKELEETNAKLAAENESLKAEDAAIEDTNSEIEDYLNEKVDVFLHKGSTGAEKEDVFVAHNGEALQIKRGHHVMIPRKFAMIIEASENQRVINQERTEQKESEWEEKVKQL